MRKPLYLLWILTSCDFDLSQLATANAKVALSPEKFATSLNEFSLDLYRGLANRKGENIFVAPFSMTSALSMVYAGARGDTAAAIAKALYFPQDSNIHTHFKNLDSMIVANNNKDGYQLSSANRLWGEQSFSFHPSFLKLTKTSYRAELKKVDFLHNAEKSRGEINSWVEASTNNKIKDLLGQGTVDSRTKLVLTNAVYFHANWQKKFKEHATDHEGKFYASGMASPHKISMMSQTTSFRHFHDPALNAHWLRLPYASNRVDGQSVAMILAIPAKQDGLDDLEKNLSRKGFANARAKMRDTRIKLLLPKFRLEQEYDLVKELGNLGMAEVFDSRKADFSGMVKNSAERLALSAAVHKTFINVYEGGTEAAGATSGTFGLTSAIEEDPLVIAADHPFCYFIVDERTGAILFVGRLVRV